MLFKVTHIDQQGHRRRARVSARNSQDAHDQMEREYGDSRSGACVRMACSPVLHMVIRANGAGRAVLKEAVCGF